MYFHMDVSENRVFTPQIIYFHTVFHYFHHPFWGTPNFWNPPYVSHDILTLSVPPEPTRFWQLVDGISFLQLGLDWILLSWAVARYDDDDDDDDDYIIIIMIIIMIIIIIIIIIYIIVILMIRLS